MQVKCSEIKPKFSTDNQIAVILLPYLAFHEFLNSTLEELLLNLKLEGKV